MNPDEMGRKSPAMEIAVIKRLVADKFGLTVAELDGRARPTWIVGPRFIAFALCRDKGHTLTSIGASFGKRDHGTVLHGCNQIETFKFHPKIQEALKTLRTQLGITQPQTKEGTE